MAVKLGNRTLPLPILQGGMGVGISLDGLAGAVAACGGMGTISSAQCGYREADFGTDPRGANLRALERQVRRAKERARGSGLVAVNVMAATTQYADSIRTALRAGADAIVSGAGLPRDLPALAAEAGAEDALLCPVVSGGRSASVIARLWDRHYGRVPDFVILEGPRAGGHLGFSEEEARQAQAGTGKTLRELLPEVLEALAPFRDKYGRDIPVFVAGGVRSGGEMRHYMDMGAAGAQFATRFIATAECDAAEGYKMAQIRAGTEDVTIVKSPVGMPGRALRSPLIQRVEAGLEPLPENCVGCLRVCGGRTAPYCISKALIAAAEGDWDKGLFFCGAEVGAVNALSTVAEQMEQIMNEWRAEA